jgi:tRNA 2-thiouridine synthesizing protein A
VPGAEESAAPSVATDILPRVIDVRGLPPPEPMVRILEELKELQPGQRLEVLHERRPMFLYPQLDDRGFSHATDEPEPGVIRIVIQRPGTDR